MILIWSLIILFGFVILLCSMYFLLQKKYKKLNLDVARIAIAIKRVRYGDFNVRLDKLNNKNLQATINSLIESMCDREMMIKEYQATLSNKNLSLEEILKQEKELRKLKEDITATLTHDMKVPVIAELNSIDFLLQGHFGSLTEKQQEVLNLMKTSNQELKELIDNILEFYKMEQKEIELKKSLVNVNDFIEKITKEMQPISLGKNIQFVNLVRATKNIEIKFDEFQIKRVIKNLLQNAITHSFKNSEIEIRTEKNENTFKIYVSNKGTVLSQDEINLIFNKYYSGQSKFRKLGTGLGLYLSKKISEAHKGDLTVSSEGELTTFILHLPC